MVVVCSTFVHFGVCLPTRQMDKRDESSFDRVNVSTTQTAPTLNAYTIVQTTKLPNSKRNSASFKNSVSRNYTGEEPIPWNKNDDPETFETLIVIPFVGSIVFIISLCVRGTEWLRDDLQAADEKENTKFYKKPQESVAVGLFAAHRAGFGFGKNMFKMVTLKQESDSLKSETQTTEVYDKEEIERLPFSDQNHDKCAPNCKTEDKAVQTTFGDIVDTQIKETFGGSLITTQVECHPEPQQIVDSVPDVRTAMLTARPSLYERGDIWRSHPANLDRPNNRQVRVDYSKRASSIPLLDFVGNSIDKTCDDHVSKFAKLDINSTTEINFEPVSKKHRQNDSDVTKTHVETSGHSQFPQRERLDSTGEEDTGSSSGSYDDSTRERLLSGTTSGDSDSIHDDQNGYFSGHLSNKLDSRNLIFNTSQDSESIWPEEESNGNHNNGTTQSDNDFNDRKHARNKRDFSSTFNFDANKNIDTASSTNDDDGYSNFRNLCNNGSSEEIDSEEERPLLSNS